ncbi:MAG: protein-L-isoaspartate O-methyltransferase [Magnetococcales bacterium]|nr:protein-L-isoaspartate O-methyltransferase [Magnetococcales bacterium]NGZ26501.1 protein-L-isoaspartate O-methyltransferase [Magnetococcales bacterium]
MNFELARTNMVKSQVLPNKVNGEHLLASLMQTPRESFVDDSYRDFAYSDMVIPLPKHQRSMLKPLQSARLIEALNLSPGNRVMVLGAGRGYEAAVLAGMGMQVFAVEENADLVAEGKSLTPPEVQWKQGDISNGWPEESPFDGVLIAGGVARVPNKAIGQLGKKGRLAAIVHVPNQPLMRALLMVGIAGGDRPDYMFETMAPYLPGWQPETPFEI